VHPNILTFVWMAPKTLFRGVAAGHSITVAVAPVVCVTLCDPINFIWLSKYLGMGISVSVHWWTFVCHRCCADGWMAKLLARKRSLATSLAAQKLWAWGKQSDRSTYRSQNRAWRLGERSTSGPSNTFQCQTETARETVKEKEREREQQVCQWKF